jgi:hypothetical protein
MGARGDEDAHYMRVGFRVDSIVNWDYDESSRGLAHLYEQAKSAQWNAASDIDWTQECRFGSLLTPRSAFEWEAFRTSPFADRPMPEWSRFQWEWQSYMVSQFLHGEQAGLVAAARLVQQLPTVDGKELAATQVIDEARHVEVFHRYISGHVPEPYPVSPSLTDLLASSIGSDSWDLAAIGIQVVIEPMALAMFRLGRSALHDALIREILDRVARDEARHLSFGALLLPPVLAELSEAEWRTREEFVIEAARLMRGRFLLAEVWERLGVDAATGTNFAETSPMMSTYRRTAFAKLGTALARVGLLTEPVRKGLDGLGILPEFPGARLTNRVIGGPRAARDAGSAARIGAEVKGPLG